MNVYCITFQEIIWVYNYSPYALCQYLKTGALNNFWLIHPLTKLDIKKNVIKARTLYTSVHHFN